MSSSAGIPAVFPRTRWSVVLAAQQRSSIEAFEALETLCRDYWYPLYAFVRRQGISSHDAQDLTQDFFRQMLEKHWLDSVDREKGRLRTFLVVALRRFMTAEWRRASAQRRGGGLIQVPLDPGLAESRYAADPSTRLAPDDLFERQWALTLLNLALDRLRLEFATAGKHVEYSVLKECLMQARGAIDYSEMSAQLGVSEGAARVAVHRLRKRFRAIYREEVAQTLTNSGDLEGEVHHLAGILAGG
jgi:RNA polymerase sigma factor (sigma-70 family)